MRKDDLINYCLEIGPSSLDLTANLNPRSHTSHHAPLTTEQLERDLQLRANQVFREDRQWLTSNLMQLKKELLDNQTHSLAILQQVRQI